MRLGALPLNLALRRSVARVAFMRYDYFCRRGNYKFNPRLLLGGFIWIARAVNLN